MNMTKKVSTVTVSTALLTLLLTGAAQAAEIPASCLSIKDNIASKIESNGVAATDFKLDIVPTALVEGKVVGNCGVGAYQIIYTRGKNINPEAHASAVSNHETVTKEVTSKVVNEAVNKPANEVVNKPANEVVNKPANEVVNKPANEIVDEAVKEVGASQPVDKVEIKTPDVNTSENKPATPALVVAR